MKDFDEIYTQICLDVQNNNLKNSQKNFSQISCFIISIIVGIFAILSCFLISSIFPFIFFIIFDFILIIILYFSKKNKEYKETIITSLIKNYDKNLNFNINGSISKETYNQGEFESYDIYRCEDSITGYIDGIIPFNMCNILTESEIIDSDGNSTYTTIFSGLFAEISLSKNSNFNLYVHSDKGLFGKLFNKKNKIEMDSQDFEKVFDVRTTDKIKAMQLLTSDIMEYLLDFKLKSGNKFELTLKNDKLYLRFHCGNIFEMPSFKNNLDKNTLELYFKYLDFSCEITKKLYNLVKETEL